MQPSPVYPDPTENSLVPVAMDELPAPLDMIELAMCGCKTKSLQMQEIQLDMYVDVVIVRMAKVEGQTDESEPDELPTDFQTESNEERYDD